MSNENESGQTEAVRSSDVLGLPALSIRQPWAWLILHGGKDVENRQWRTSFRGRVLIHAAKGCTQLEYGNAAMFAFDATNGRVLIPPLSDLPRGGIVGEVEITGCWVKHSSPWFVGLYGFSLANPKPIPFAPCRGALGFFRPNT